MTASTFTEQERADIVGAYVGALKELGDLEFEMTDQANITDAAIKKVSILSSRLSALADRYRSGLPIAALSRCPFSGKVVSHSFDPYGFDGMWWQYHDPLRPPREPSVGPYFLALTGAVRIQVPPEYTEFLAVVGPGAPFVIPRVLRLPQVRAVISVVKIGKHRGTAIAYFANADIGDVRPPTVWGTQWTTLDPDLRSPLEEASDMEHDFDFELERWVHAGRLLWIAPGDTTLTLRNDLEGCPYFKLSNERDIQRLQYGECWTS